MVGDAADVPSATTWAEKAALSRSIAAADLDVGVGTAHAVIVLFTQDDYAYQGTKAEVAFALGRGLPVFAVAPTLARLLKDGSSAGAPPYDAQRVFTGPKYADSFLVWHAGVRVFETEDAAVDALLSFACDRATSHASA